MANWRCSVIAGWVKNFRKIIQEEKPEHCWVYFIVPGMIMISMVHVARYWVWTMIHCKWMFMFFRQWFITEEWRSEWVKENIEWLSDKLNNHSKIWPIVQAYNDPRIITSEI